MFLSTYFVFSQSMKSVEGTVTDVEGIALPGVNVVVKESALGTVTDFDGNYTLKVENSSVLVFSYLGFETQEISASGKQVINAKLLEDTESLNEVVITALGISRDKKSLGYATQEVKGEELAAVKSGNFTNAISGKASGVQIKRNNNMGGSTNVVIRGSSSMGGNNQALFVVDGVPINNYNSNTASQQSGSGASYDYGNTASDINPEDIESINILKGAAASALYGSRAANGVIIIETKKGKNSKGLGVTINSGITIGSVDKSTFAKYQTQYGAGYGQYYDGPGSRFYEEDVTGDGVKDLVSLYTEDGSYGAAFDSDLLVYQWDSLDPELDNYQTATPWENAENGPITFFENAVTVTNSVAIENASDKGSFRLSYTNFDQKGIMPNSSIKKNNFSLRGTAKLNDKLSASGMANYIKSEGLGRNSTGYNDNVVSNFKQWWQTNVDISELKDAYFSTRRNVTWNPSSSDAGSTPIYWDNPYWTRYENYQDDTRHRFIGNMSLNYELADWLNVTGRVATDTYSEIQEERRANGSVATAFGISRGNVSSGYLRRNLQNTETNFDLMFNFDKDLTEELNLKGIIGGNIRRNSFESISASTSGGLVIEKLYSLQNSKDNLPLPVEVLEKGGVDGVYASASLGFKNTYFLDGTIRRDVSSTLPSNNNTYFYPSVAGSFVFSNLIDSSVLSFGKIRANYAQVGNDAEFDNLSNSYVINTAVGGASSTSVKSVKNNPDLKPEETTSVELGLEMKLLKNRVGFDVALYQTNSVDQIFEVPLSRATGYSSALLNAGEIENKGIEVSLYGAPVKTNNFKWDVNVNWSKNINEVVSLTEGIENLTLGSFQGGVSVNARVGEAYGVITGTDYTYLDGQKVIDADSGAYVVTTTSDNVIGDTNPEWQMGISNKFKYKNISFSFLIDIQKGGDIFSLDQYYGLATGLYAETAFTNDLGNPVRNTLADGGGFVNVGVNADGSTNTTRIAASDFGAFGYSDLPNSAFVYDASYVKLREVVLTYDFPQSIFDTSFLEGASLSFIGSNLWIIHKNLPHADPESGLGSGNVQGYSAGSLPTTRDYGFNIKLQF